MRRPVNTVYHPTTENEIVDLVKNANIENLKLRVAGSEHSVKESICDGCDITIKLDRYIDIVEWDEYNMRVVVEAGCHLGHDPQDINSNLQNSLVYQLDQRGWALPDLGGITHQTIGGYVSTGSAGGSATFSFGDAIVGIRIVDGTGTVRDFCKPDYDPTHDDEFYGVVVSMGLLGIISTVTLQCIPAFNVFGRQDTTKVDDCEIDLFGDGTGTRQGLQSFLEETEYTRLLWWPQSRVEKIVVWKARRMLDSDYNSLDHCSGCLRDTGTPDNFRPKPYKEFPEIFGSPLPVEVGIFVFFSLVGKWPDWLHHLVGHGILFKILRFIGERLCPTVVLPIVLNLFARSDPPCKNDPSQTQPQEFWDVWWQGLPMDNQASDKLLATEFTEMWIPISQTREVMIALGDHYESKGHSATGSYSCEIYPEKRSDFWLSPANLEGTDELGVVRIDVFWFSGNKGRPETDYYPQFWELLARFNYKLHWGKQLPINSAEYLSLRFTRWEEFMALRDRMDPNRIFLTPYWECHLFGTDCARAHFHTAAVETAIGVSSPVHSIINFKTVMIVAAILASAAGLLLLAVPEPLAAWFGIQLGDGGASVARLLGAADVGAGLLSWWVRNTTKLEIKKLVLKDFIVIDGLSFVISLIAQLCHVFNNKGWIIVGVYLVLTVAFVFELCRKPELSRARAAW